MDIQKELVELLRKVEGLSNELLALESQIEEIIDALIDEDEIDEEDLEEDLDEEDDIKIGLTD